MNGLEHVISIPGAISFVVIEPDKFKKCLKNVPCLLGMPS